MNHCKPEKVCCQNEFKSVKKAGPLPRNQEIGKLKDKREGLQSSLRMNDGMLPKKLKDRGALPKEDGFISRFWTDFTFPTYSAIPQERNRSR